MDNNLDKEYETDERMFNLYYPNEGIGLTLAEIGKKFAAARWDKEKQDWIRDEEGNAILFPLSRERVRQRLVRYERHNMYDIFRFKDLLGLEVCNGLVKRRIYSLQKLADAPLSRLANARYIGKVRLQRIIELRNKFYAGEIK